MNLLTSNKLILGLLSAGSIVVVGAMKDYNNHRVVSSNKELTVEEIAVVERNVASEAVSKVAQMYLPMNDENIKKVNGAWEIVRIVDSKEQVAFDKNQNSEDSKKTIKVKMDLIGNGVVRIDNDNEQVYRVSLLSNFGTIALFKKVDNGYEILEAKRLNTISSVNKLEVSEEVELVLERALNQAKSPKILTGNDISGELTLKSKSLSNLSVEIRNPNGETQNVSIDFADLMDGGAFKAEVNGEEVSGVVFNNGKDGYRLSFVTGPMAGAMLNFVTKEQLQNIQSNEVDTSYEENTKAEEAKNAQQEVMEERQITAQNSEVQVEAPALTTEEVKEVAQEQGFAF